MHRPIIYVLMFLAMLCGVSALYGEDSNAVAPNLVPQPVKMSSQPGAFTLTRETTIVTDAAAKATSRYLAEAIRPLLGTTLAVRGPTTALPPKPVSLSIDSSLKSLGPEGYLLEITPNRVRMRAAEPAGLFYACQTFRQLLPAIANAAADRAGKKVNSPGACTVPCVRVEDWPRFAWRGLMLDPARYFLSKELLKRYIDLLALHKMNRLHLHLTDATGWTLQMRSYPELTDMRRWPMQGPQPSDDVYRPDDVRELVNYATSRHVMLIPEIETVGHTAIPSLILRDKVLCSNNPCRKTDKLIDPRTADLLAEPCPSSPKAFAVFRDILKETMAMFPSPYIHLGGDEFYGLAWETCPECRALVNEESVRCHDTQEHKRLFANCQGSRQKYLLYRYWMTKLCDYVRSQGRQPIVWDDLTWRGDFPKGAIVMQWHYKGGQDWMNNAITPENPATEAALAGHAAIAVPFSHLYFDLKPTLKMVYSCEPMPDDVPSNRQNLILGPHAAAWAQPPSELDVRMFPQLYALAELGWSPSKSRDWKDFCRRLERHQDKMKVFFVSQPKFPAGR